MFDGVDARYRACAAFRYKKGLSKSARLAMHRELAKQLDRMGEQGYTLIGALEAILAEFCKSGIIELPT